MVPAHSENPSKERRGRVALIVEGKREVHAPCRNGNYRTMCGLDGDDFDQEEVQAAPGEKINCPDCRAIWTHAKALRASDFAPVPAADPQIDGGLPFTRADEEQLRAQADYYDEESQKA